MNISAIILRSGLMAGIALLGEELFAQKKAGFNGRQIQLSEIRRGQPSMIAAKAFGGKKLIIAEGNPEAFGKGIALGENRFLISVPESVNSTQLAEAGISSWAALPPSEKIHSELQKKIIRKNAGKSDVYIVCAPGVDEKQIRAAWKPGWGTIKDVWQSDGFIRLTISADPAQIRSIAAEGWSMQMEESEGEIIAHSVAGGENGRVNTIASAGFGWSTGLNGNGVTVGVGDGGMVDNHADLVSHQFNLITSKLSSFGDHPDHVSGTIGGLGLINPAMKGMAPGARILNHQTSNIISNATSLRSRQNMTITNNSYGNTLSCTRAGQYNSTSSLMDGQTVGNPDLLHVISAGNAGTSTCSPYPAGFFNLSDGYPVAKNCLTVGQVNASDVSNVNSCKGPARDGRLKPEIVSNGELNSTIPSDAYGFRSGTSQSAPVLTGTLALLSQRFKELQGGQNPDAALLKGLVCNTADDLGLANADFSTGYGRLNARKARRVLEAAQFFSGSIASNVTQNQNVTVPAGASSVKIMLVWTDPAAASNPSRALINDLNLSVLRSNGTSTFPWVLNPSSTTVNQAAVRGIDSLNNMEQVTLTTTPGEVLTIRVGSRTISGSSQKYWVVYDWVRPELVLTAPVQNEFIQTATAYGFRWDISSYTFSSMVLESSVDSSIWTTAQTITNSSSLLTSFTPGGTAYRRLWFRLRGVSGGQNILSNAVRIFHSPVPAPVATVCDRTARLVWPAVTGATRYELFRLNRVTGSWDAQGSTTELQAYFGSLNNGTREFFAVRPWFGNSPGLMSTGVAALPAATACNWTKDLGISRLISPVSGRLNTSTAPGTSIQLELQNYSSTAVSAQVCTLNYRRADGVVQQFPLNLSIGAGLKQNYTVPVSLINTQAGTQNLNFWLSTAGDENKSNDTLKSLISILPNEQERIFPLTLNFESLPAFSLNSRSTGISGESRLDFTSTNQARAFSSARNAPVSFGSRSLVMDKERVDGLTATGEAIFTFNLSAFASPREFSLSFDVMSFGSLTTGNAVSFRPSDQAAWIPVRNFWQEGLVVGTPKSIRDINLLPLLNGAALTSSFQLRFTSSGTRSSEFETSGGYAVDNIVLKLPVTIDLAATGIIAPEDNCYSISDERPVTIQIKNNGDSLANIPVSYRVNGQNTVTEVLQGIRAGETKNYTFNQKLTASQFGLMEIEAWVTVLSDANPSNNKAASIYRKHWKIESNLPYLQSFEGDDGGWFAENFTNSYQWKKGKGKLSQAVADTAANGLGFWYITNSSSGSSGISYLYSPCFNISPPSDPTKPNALGNTFNFNKAYQLGVNDSVWVEISLNGGVWDMIPLSDTYTPNSTIENHFTGWNNQNCQWRPSSFLLGGSGNSVRFRFAYANRKNLQTGDQNMPVSESGFSVDDFLLERYSLVETQVPFSEAVSVAQSDTSSWLNFGNYAGKIRKLSGLAEASFSYNYLPSQPPRTIGEKLYLNRNFLLNAGPITQQTVSRIRLYIHETDIQDILMADSKLLTPMKLGIWYYTGPGQDLEIENNDLSAVENIGFIPAYRILKIPAYGGLYLEFDGPVQAEYYICRENLTGGTSEFQALRTATANIPPRDASHIKWLTPLDENVKSLDKKLAWLDQDAEMLYLDGINGNSARIRLLDIKGQIMLDESFTGYRFETRTSGLSKGIYTLRVEQESGAETFRLSLD